VTKTAQDELKSGRVNDCIEQFIEASATEPHIRSLVGALLIPNMPISVYRLSEMPIQSCGQSVSAPRGKACAGLNAHTELRAKRQHSAREAIHRNRPIKLSLKDADVEWDMEQHNDAPGRRGPRIAVKSGSGTGTEQPE